MARFLAASMAALAAGLSGGTAIAQAPQGQSQYDVSITRTQYNIPHITAYDWGSAGYGVAYAYAQDNFCMLAEEFATVAGTRSLYFGPENTSVLGFSEVDNLTSDTFYRARANADELRSGWSQQSEKAQRLSDGYIAGYNRYLADTGVENLPSGCRNAPWVRPITRDDMIRLNEKQMLLASSLALAPGIATASPPQDAKQSAAANVDYIFPQHPDLQFGSNGWAFGAEATTDGGGLLIGNPHFPWDGPARFWQLHLTIPGEYDAMGTGIAGTPVVTLGFNKDVAWTHTVTAARHFVLYMLTLAPDDPTSYMLDGERVKMTETIVTVPMPDGAEPVTRTLYSTRFGPVVTLPNSPMGWSQQMAFALSDANIGNTRAIDTWMRMGQARNVTEINEVVSDTLGIPWVNTIAADRHGDALHADITAVPGVSAEMAADCATPFSGLVANRVTLLDGTRAQCDWRKGDGSLLPSSQQASRTRRDYVTNSNDSYWISNPRNPYRQLSPILGAFERPLSLRTRSNFTETEAMLAEAKFDHDRAKQLVYGNKSLAADMVVEPLLEQCAGNEELSEACGVLARWDRRFELDSRGAHLFALFWEKVRGEDDLWQVPFDANDPVNTPRDLDVADEKSARLLTALGDTAKELSEAGISLNARLADVVTRRDGAAAIGIHGGPGTSGVLNMQIGVPTADGGYTPRHGSSYIQIVSFNDNGPRAEAVLSYSQSSNPESPHYADQTWLYSTKQWNSLPFHADDIAAQQRGQTLRLTE